MDNRVGDAARHRHARIGGRVEEAAYVKFLNVPCKRRESAVVLPCPDWADTDTGTDEIICTAARECNGIDIAQVCRIGTARFTLNHERQRVPRHRRVDHVVPEDEVDIQAAGVELQVSEERFGQMAEIFCGMSRKGQAHSHSHRSEETLEHHTGSTIRPREESRPAPLVRSTVHSTPLIMIVDGS